MNLTHLSLRILSISKNILYQTYANQILGNIQIDWKLILPCQSDPCPAIVEPLRSSIGDIQFPPESLHNIDSIPENISLSPVLFSSGCVFMNFYSNSTTKTITKGILTPFEIIDRHVYLMICFLVLIGYSIRYLRNNIKCNRRKEIEYEERKLKFIRLCKKLFDSRCGLLLVLLCSLSVHYVLHLLATSFTTKYSISFREPPIEKWSDLKIDQSIFECGSDKNLYCYHFADRALRDTNPLYPIVRGSVTGYIKPRIDRERIILFESNAFTRRIIHIYCNAMINVQRDHNFYVQTSTNSYYDTFFVIIYNSRMKSERKNLLKRTLYSCFEYGFCPDAYDRTFRIVLEKGKQPIEGSNSNAQCDDYVQSNDGPDKSYRPISLINITEALHLYFYLIGFSCSILVIELLFHKKTSQSFELQSVKQLNLIV